MTPKVMDLASREGRRPTWEMALIYPDEGGWTVDDYLRLDIGRHVEFSSGTVELQPLPDERHQAIVFFLVQALKAHASAHGGKATMAPFPLRLWEDNFREPDVLFLAKEKEHLSRSKRKRREGADLVIEVLSESNRDLDLDTKRAEYAMAGIPEYWVVDPDEGTIAVLALEKRKYAVRGRFGKGQEAVSRALPGFRVRVAEAIEAE